MNNQGITRIVNKRHEIRCNAECGIRHNAASGQINARHLEKVQHELDLRHLTLMQ
jgi:hypothetical protein